MIKSAIVAVWNWFLSWSLGWLATDWGYPSLPPPQVYIVCDIWNAQYRVLTIYNDEYKARESLMRCIMANPQRRYWLLQVLDLYRPPPPR